MAHIVTLNTPSREDWLSQLADVITSPDELLRLLDLDQHPELLAGREAKRLFALRVPRAFVARMEKGNPDDPLLKQTLTSQDEFITAPGYSTDPLEEQNSVVPGLLHKYLNRALLLVKGGCAVNCRYCFRRHFPYAENQGNKRNWQVALDYIAAHPELDEIIKERLNQQSSIGFAADLKDKYDEDPNLLQQVTLEDLRNFGMIPEFLGRLPIIFSLENLTKDMLVKIMKEPRNAILKQYEKLLELDEVKLEFADDALEAIAQKAMEKKTGARALRSILEDYMLDIMYEIPKDDNIGEVTITRAYIEGTGGPVIQLRGQAVPRLDG
mgnify:CR=1 FL=1